ncbi:MAG TPA: PilN domain-containing protein [Bradyrhizobium sp.]|uniref:PilN domain-containing protein n=1 Tax=Bradyrhizobium sp. TaxID=376 RepID=UPI002D8097EC|nr:PilN domain-containing protein [Bradyrhizobium sp.]HET7886503.1 PilN domain-containing protein [Bradyrhizobium sp.]
MSEAKALFEEWIAAVAGAVETLIGRYAPRPQIELVGESTGLLTARLKSARKGPQLADVSFRISGGRPMPPLPPDWQAAFRGSRVETELASADVLFRPLDFPKQAADFLDGMIRTQIDRLTPWSAEEAAFGWSAPSPSGQERIELTLAATSRRGIEPLVQLASALGVQSLTAFAAPAAGGREKIKVLDQTLRGAAFHGLDTPRTLRIALLSAAAVAAVSLLAGVYFGDSLDSEQQQLMQRISQRRAALRLGPDGGSAFGLLSKRKQSSPSTVVVLEALSKALPDGTYVTELRIDGDKVQVVGMTQDAPSLIRLIEKSPQFARATFFAPTTRAQNAPGEQFHIEARITPSFGPNS